METAPTALGLEVVAAPHTAGVRKNFVLDTNVLLHDAGSIFAFADNCVVVPIYCIEELDQFKKDLSELGRNARQVSRELDQLRGLGSIIDGVPLPNGGLLRVGFTDLELPKRYANSHMTDNSILATALAVQKADPGSPLIFVTMDTNLRIRAEAVGIKAVDYDRERVDISEMYTGMVDFVVPDAVVEGIYASGAAEIKDTLAASDRPDYSLSENEYALLRGQVQTSSTALVRTDVTGGKFIHLPRMKDGIWGIRPRNKEQHFALEALLRDEVRLVTLVGKAGTGKTLLALAAGLHRTTDAQAYQRMLISRPIFPLGRDIGYLPGSVEEKLTPWMQPIYDNLDLLTNMSKGERRDSRGYQELLHQGFVQIEPLTYIRGRSIPNQYLIVDEAQNLTPHEVKTIITRAGDGTKIVLTGDPYQIDNPYVDMVNNGLTYVANKFRNEKIAAHITLSKGERSELAERASNLL